MKSKILAAKKTALAVALATGFITTTTAPVQAGIPVIDGGNLAQLCRASSGMVVNNSSAALSAMGFKTPVKVLGEAFFDKMDGGRRSLVPILARAAERGEIETDDPDQAARHFFALCRGDLFLRRLFCGADACCDERMRAHVREAVRAFLRIYRPTS